ncbi:MarR family winged helix-turn-helix transcriptional regulator [Cohnella zeiphila]|uniref:MarR family transcriptional regulator n=1 Tax=Cohnella zeiphila TaxID=2761120 RepID=A0A7X0SNQ3_9BACL|nr:MarR family transcriptional regulator [Cohnella zeiphila]MBB6733196.1 MarR family transcriptional regulator [Cohnella zeiphila]
MEDRSLELIEQEMTLLARRITAIASDKRFGTLDRSAYLLLNHISFLGPSGVKALAEELRLDISTVSRQTAALEQKGFVIRIPDPRDGRAFTFQLSETGTAALNEDRQARLAQLRALLEEWSEEERSSFGKLLNKFNHTFSKEEG